MPNFERYNKLHGELMKRLEDGEITIEQAKEVNDLAFDKYIGESNNIVEETSEPTNNSSLIQFLSKKVQGCISDEALIRKKYAAASEEEKPQYQAKLDDILRRKKEYSDRLERQKNKAAAN